MKNFSLLLCVTILGACATPTPIPQDIQDKVALIPAEELPKNRHLEKTHCPKHLNQGFDKRRECQVAIRRELAARDMMREQKEQAEQGNMKEENNENIKN